MDDFVKQAKAAGYDDQTIQKYVKFKQFQSLGGAPNIQAQEQPGSEQVQQYILGANGPVTDPYGAYSQADVFSGGINSGTDFGVPDGTPVALPPVDSWRVVDSYTDANPGYIGDQDNKGYGNSVFAQNEKTGEKLRFDHLSKNNTYVGQELKGGAPIGATGHSGNASGPHLDLEYYDPNGQIGDVMQSYYGKYIMPQGQ